MISQIFSEIFKCKHESKEIQVSNENIFSKQWYLWYKDMTKIMTVTCK